MTSAIAAIGISTPSARPGASRPRPNAAPEPIAPGRALVPVAEPRRAQTSLARPRPLARHAAFYAHLIATRAQAPQTRARRRIEPAEGVSTYRVAGELAPGRAQPRILRTI